MSNVAILYYLCPMKKHIPFLGCLTLLVASLAMCRYYHDEAVKSRQTEADAVRIDMLTVAYNDSCLRMVAYLIGIRDTAQVVRLARFETGHYKSHIFRHNKNLFGMKYHKKMPTLAIGQDANGFAIYPSYLASVVDLKLYYMKYGDHLRGYCEIKGYKEVIK